MKKNFIKIFIFVLVVICPAYVNALTITASSTTITPGGSIRVTVRPDGLIGKFSVTSSNSNVLSGGTGSVWLENDAVTYTFTSKGIGSATITVNAIDASDSNGNAWSGSKSVTVNVVKPREKSNNNNLKSLGIEGHEITPVFNKDVLEYSAEVGDEVETIKINANMEDSYGHVEGAGEVELKEGKNTFEIKAISETGKEKVYTLNVTVKDNNPIEKTIDGKKYTVVKRASSLVLPEGLDKETFTLNKVEIEKDVEIPYYYNEELKLGFAGLKDEKGNIYLFKLEDNMITEKYELLSSKGLNIEFTKAKNIPEGYTKKEITIDGKEYTAYQNKYKDYALIYGKNLNNEEEGWYLYNIKEKSIQKYFGNIIEDLNKEIKDLKDMNQVLIISLIGASTLFLLILIIEIIFNHKNKKQLKKLKKNEIKEESTKIEEPKKEKKKDKNKKEEISEEKKIIAEKVEEPVKEKKKKNKEKENDGEDIPNIDEIVEDLKTTETPLNEKEEQLKEFEEFYGKSKKSKKFKL